MRFDVLYMCRRNVNCPRDKMHAVLDALFLAQVWGVVRGHVSAGSNTAAIAQALSSRLIGASLRCPPPRALPLPLPRPLGWT